MKLTILEYGSGLVISDEMRPLIDRANKVIQRALHLNRNALVVSDGKLRALGVAGTMRLSKDIEIVIAPKMLKDHAESDWKESLYLLSALSKYGNIITTEHIHSSTAYKDSLYDIAGRVLAREYASCRRKPIRQYRREHFYDYSIDGDVNFDRVLDRNPDGIPQTKVSFDKINPYNATIQAAMRIVLPYIKDSAVNRSLIGAIQELGKQGSFPVRRLAIPARNHEWNDIYNLAFDVVSGMGSSFESGEIMSPSFIVDTWRIWEWLITISLRVGLGNRFRVIPQAATPWGKKRTSNKVSQVNVFPDVAVYGIVGAAPPVFLVDAKYKELLDTDSIEIDRSDLYEAFAFCNATGASKILLAYPRAPGPGTEAGRITNVASYEIGSTTICAVKVAFGSITKQGDITAFCRRVSSEIMALI